MPYNIWIGDDVPTLVQGSSEPSSLPGRIPFSEVLLTSQTLSQGTLSGSTSYRQQAQLEVFIRDINTAHLDLGAKNCLMFLNSSSFSTTLYKHIGASSSNVSIQGCAEKFESIG